MGRGDSLALDGNLPRDSVSIKILVVVQPKSTSLIQMYNVFRTNNKQMR